jgi:Ser/Thr protein kinase RdoA (MazF antagonist)
MPAMNAPAAPPFAGLTPDAVLNAIDAVDLTTSGTLLTLNSYENRVFQVGVEDADGRNGFVVAKFYRPGRWSDAQIAEEHAFVAELAAREIPAVPPLALGGRTLHHWTDAASGSEFRLAVYPRRGGRAPNLDDPTTLEWLGRFIGRIHAVGSAAPFVHRPALDSDSFGREPRSYLLEHDWLPESLRDMYAQLSQQALDEVQRCQDRAGDTRRRRLHGDVHEGNVLWTPDGPHFVDFDDARTGPAVQDLWMLLGDRAQAATRLRDLLAGYEDFMEFDRRELLLIEALRTLRLIHYSAWIARRWDDPAFPAAFPWFGAPRYWEERILELREQIAVMQEPSGRRPPRQGPHRSRNASSARVASGVKKYSMMRRVPVLISTVTAIPGVSCTILPSMSIVLRSSATRVW